MSAASTEEVVDTAKILDKEWERVQKKTFTKWTNAKLRIQREEPVQDLTTDLADGIKLVKLLSVISDTELKVTNKAPKMRIQQCENVEIALKFIKDSGLKLVNMGATDIVDGNERLILGLLWTIILRFTIADISEEGLSSKAGLLLWCQRKTKGYQNVEVKDFTMSWQNGLAFCALIHKHRPDLIDFDTLDKSNKAANLELAFEVAENKLGIPRLLDVDDILQLARPDERSIMTYVASYFHYFSQFDKLEAAGRRVGKFITVARTAAEMQHDYEQRANALLDSSNQKINEWSNSQFDGTFNDAKSKSAEFDEYKRKEKRQWIKERQELDTLLSSIQAKLQASNMPYYTPPPGLDTPDINTAIGKLADAEGLRRRDITTQIRQVKDKLRKIFADLANSFHEELKNISNSLATLEGPFQAQLESVNNLKGNIFSLESNNHVDLQKAHQECLDANTDENEYTIYDVDDLDYELTLVKNAMNKISAYIENQIISSQVTNVTPEQLAEFEETFRHFDKDGNNTLTQLEFKAGLAALGKSYADEEFKTIFSKVSGGEERISFEQFVDFMKNLEEDKFSPDQIRESFKALAGSKSYLTEEDLMKGSMTSQETSFIAEKMDKNENGYDYNAYLNSLFDSSRPTKFKGRRQPSMHITR